jgi:outer membrane immunogenic protein
MPWLGTVRGRAGLALDNVLVYLTAGLAYGKTNHSVSDVTNGSTNPEIFHDFSTTKIGAVAGGGIEYGLDPRWSVKAEALYVDLGATREFSRPLAILTSNPVFPVAWRRSTQCGSCAPG